MDSEADGIGEQSFPEDLLGAAHVESDERRPVDLNDSIRQLQSPVAVDPTTRIDALDIETLRAGGGGGGRGKDGRGGGGKEGTYDQ